MKKFFVFFLLTGSLTAFLFVDTLQAQIESPLLVFTRGKLWQSVFYGKVGPNFSNWGRRGIGLDWPGFDEIWIRDDIGGPASHLVTGGFWVGAKKMKDSILTVEDWSMYGGTIAPEITAKYIVKKHRQVFPDGQNYWRRINQSAGEEVFETVWEYNPNFPLVDDRETQLPIRVTRTAHQWNGSLREENYVLYEYVFKNISNEIKLIAPERPVADTLYDFYLLLNYALHSNSRSWRVLFPALTEGARNTWFFYDPARRMIWGRAANYPETVGNEEYGFSTTQGLLVNGEPQGEWLAPAFVGVRLIYSSPDKTGAATRVNKYGWSAGSNSIDLSGPFTGIGTNEAKYAVVENPAFAANFVATPADDVYMRRSRMWSLMSLGPWDIGPGDSIVVAIAEIVDGVDYNLALDKNISAALIGSQGQRAFNASADKAKFTYDNGFRTPSPPEAPSFEVDFYEGERRIVANKITWSNEKENIPDPDDGELDLLGYRLYRSSHLPIGPWNLIATVTKEDPFYYDAIAGKYIFVDSLVSIGTNYYYALTAFDTGKVSWSVNPSAIFPETNSNKVPPLESSIFANRMVYPFVATFPPESSVDNVIVVPNPFVIREGFSQPGEGDVIQFVNIPNPCTIRIFTVRGDLVKTIDVVEGTGALTSWNQVSDYGQFVESGVYIFHVESSFGNKTGKFAIVR